MHDLKLLDQYMELVEDQIDNEEADRALGEMADGRDEPLPWDRAKRDLGMADD